MYQASKVRATVQTTAVVTPMSPDTRATSDQENDEEGSVLFGLGLVLIVVIGAVVVCIAGCVVYWCCCRGGSVSKNIPSLEASAVHVNQAYDSSAADGELYVDSTMGTTSPYGNGHGSGDDQAGAQGGAGYVEPDASQPEAYARVKAQTGAEASAGAQPGTQAQVEAEVEAAYVEPDSRQPEASTAEHPLPLPLHPDLHPPTFTPQLPLYTA